MEGLFGAYSFIIWWRFMQKTEHTCYCCKETKPLDKFYKDKWRRHGYSYLCKKCYLLKYCSDPKQKRKRADTSRLNWRKNGWKYAMNVKRKREQELLTLHQDSNNNKNDH